jgi:hypothetical protein
VAACSVVSGTLLAFFHAEAPSKIFQRTLTLSERVAYQRAIEDVYWRHRIWPRERPDPKPSLDAVMSQAQLEKKVTDYLRNSQALEDYWQRPITAEQLQAEMERVAQHTRQPEVLRELFEALGNDPFVIAECLARPALAERLVSSWYAYDERIHGELKQRVEAELQAYTTVEQMKQLSGTYSEIELVRSDSGETVEQAHLSRRSGTKVDRLPSEQLAGGAPALQRQDPAPSVKLNRREWDETVQGLATTFNESNAARASHFGVRRHVAGLESADMSAHSKQDAAETYDAIPIGKLSSLQQDETRYYGTAVIEKTNDRLKLATVAWPKEPLESWLARVENQIPTAIGTPSASYVLPKISDEGGCIDDTWAATAGAPTARAYHTAIWTGTEMIVWGGGSNSGGRYNPATDRWVPTSTSNAPSGRAEHTAVWTGSEMIVWGGTNGSNNLNTGGKYNPASDSWTATTTTNAPTGREYHTAVWTGSEMIVWGGE